MPIARWDDDMERHPGVLSCRNRSCGSAEMPGLRGFVSGRSALPQPVRSSLI